MTRQEMDGRALEWTDDVVDGLGYDDAVAYAYALGDGWRLPTVAELVGLWDYAAGVCPLFPAATGWTWTAERYTGPDVDPSAPSAWAVLFRDGSLDDVGLTFPAAVRVCRTVT